MRNTRWSRQVFYGWRDCHTTTVRQRIVMRRVTAIMAHRLTASAYSRWRELVKERQWAVRIGGQVLRRMRSALMARAFSRWLVWLRSMRKAVAQTRAVLVRIMQRCMSAAFNGWATEHRSRQRLWKLMTVCICRIKRGALARAYGRWSNKASEQQPLRRKAQHVVYRLRSLTAALAFSLRLTAPPPPVVFCMTVCCAGLGPRGCSEIGAENADRRRANATLRCH